MEEIGILSIRWKEYMISDFSHDFRCALRQKKTALGLVTVALCTERGRSAFTGKLVREE